MPSNPPTRKASSFELRGSYVVLCILALTGVVGSLFIYLGPRATDRHPGIVHVGVRYMDEATMDFLRYGKHGPEAKIELLAPDGSVVYVFSGLRIGRNLMPLEDIPSGRYIARVSAEDYLPAEVPVQIEGRMLNPVPDTNFPEGTFVDFNMIGARLKPHRF